MKLRVGIAMASVVLAGCSGGPPTAPPPAPGVPLYLNPDAPLEERVEDLLGRMTLEEKVGQTLYTAPAIERLGIPAYNWWNEALHGVARAGVATVFPQAIGLAATFDADHMLEVATAISDEARAKNNEWIRRGRRGIYEGLTFWSPNINIFRDPRWGRGMETYGEDPYLTGELAAAFVRGMQGDDPTYLKTVATPKHFAVHSGPEPDRHTFDAVVGEPDLRETYLPAFRTAVQKGGAMSVMCAYNRFRGDPACASKPLLQDILRDEWGFDGYVVSDCWAISDIYSTHKFVATQAEAAALALEAGTDLNCGVSFGSLVEAVRKGLTTEARVDTAVRRLLTARFRLGMFDPVERVPWAHIPYSVNDSPEHRALALETAHKSMVLLKNDGGLLPLSKELGTIAVIGPNADDVEVLLGNYNGFPSDPVTPLRGIREKVSPGVRIVHARGSGLADELPVLETIPRSVLRPAGAVGSADGLRAEYFDNPDLDGTPLAVRTDGTVDFRWWGYAPLAGLRPGAFSVRWTGTLVPPTSGRYALGGKGLGDFRVFVDDSVVAAYSSEHEINTGWTDFEMEAGVPREIRVEYRPRREDGAVQLVWAPPVADQQAEAMRLVESADAVVMVLGLSPRLEGEEMRVAVPGFAGGDRVDIGLPAAQQRLMEAVVASGKPVVLVLLNGSALGLGWAAENVPAILEAWYPGQAGGTAIADVLFGDYNPAGRLPVTFYASADQLPPFDAYDMEGRTYRYFHGDPVFPFGYGLSYTSFAYADLELPARVNVGDDVDVSVEVQNTGTRAGEEVVQLYVTDVEASGQTSIRSLQGFERVSLRPGERRKVSFHLSPRQFSLVDVRGARVVEPGWFEISVGGKQPGFTGLADAAGTGVVTGRLQWVDEAGSPAAQEDAYVEETDPLVREKLQQWQDLKLGLLLHWGPYSQWGLVESWSICSEDEDWCNRRSIDDYGDYKKAYEGLQTTFNPVDFDPARWAQAARDAGMRYVVFTTKHHDGFSMFDTRRTDYRITSPRTPFSTDSRADVTRGIFDAFRERGFMVGAYFSKPDWHSLDFWWPYFATPDRYPNYDVTKYPERWGRFVDFTHAQIRELMSDYGPVDILWLDGGWVRTRTEGELLAFRTRPGFQKQRMQSLDIKMPGLVREARQRQPGLIVVDRDVPGPYQNYLTPEARVPDDPYKPPRELVHMLVDVVAKGGNLLLNVGPGPDGRWHDDGACTRPSAPP